MNAAEILQDLAQIGVSIKPIPERGTVLLDPIDAVPDTLKDQIVQHKPELLEILVADRQPQSIDDLTDREQATWKAFLSLAKAYNVTETEIVREFSLKGRIDWCEVSALVGADLNLCMQTLAATIIRNRDFEEFKGKVVSIAKHRNLANCQTCKHLQLDTINPTGGLSYCQLRPDVRGAVPPVSRECSKWEANP